MRRAKGLGLEMMNIHALLTATVQNLRRLAGVPRKEGTGQPAMRVGAAHPLSALSSPAAIFRRVLDSLWPRIQRRLNFFARPGFSPVFSVTGVFSEAAGKRPFSVRRRPRSGPQQLGRILAALAQLKPPGLFRNRPLSLLEEFQTLDYQVQIIAIAPHLTKELQFALMRAARDRRTFYLQTGPAQEGDATVPPRARSLPVTL